MAVFASLTALLHAVRAADHKSTTAILGRLVAALDADNHRACKGEEPRFLPADDLVHLQQYRRWLIELRRSMTDNKFVQPTFLAILGSANATHPAPLDQPTPLPASSLLEEANSTPSPQPPAEILVVPAPLNKPLSDITLARFVAGYLGSDAIGRQFLPPSVLAVETVNGLPKLHRCMACPRILTFFNAIPLFCGHKICQPCLRARYDQDNGLHGVECCGKELDITRAGKFLTREKAEQAFHDRSMLSSGLAKVERRVLRGNSPQKVVKYHAEASIATNSTQIKSPTLSSQEQKVGVRADQRARIKDTSRLRCPCRNNSWQKVLGSCQCECCEKTQDDVVECEDCWVMFCEGCRERQASVAGGKYHEKEDGSMKD